MAGLYLHIPFCKQACSYCDFYFVTQQDRIPAFVDGLIREIRQAGEIHQALVVQEKGHVHETKGQVHENGEIHQAQESLQTVRTIYLGGGTPSLLSIGQLEQIFRALDDTFDLQPEEVTIEMNPDDADLSRLRAWKDLGINRVSMGIQSFDDGLLQAMHRAHTRREALDALNLLEKSGFERFTADLIYGNPGQTIAMLDADLRQMLAFSPPHISAYALMVEQGTRLGKQVELGRVTVPDDEQVATHFRHVQERLGEAGYLQYEVSNFALPGCEALHNTNYWRHVDYLGFGPSAHSFLWPRGDGRALQSSDSLAQSTLAPPDRAKYDSHASNTSAVNSAAITDLATTAPNTPKQNVAIRWQNIRDLRAYLEAEKPADRIESQEWLGLPELAEERITLGLRMQEGVDGRQLKEQYGYTFGERQLDWISLQSSLGTFAWDPDKERLRLTQEGLSLADHLTAKLLSLH